MQKPNLKQTLHDAFEEVRSFLLSQNEADCYLPEGNKAEKWSVAQHLQHLILSTVPIVSVLKQVEKAPVLADQVVPVSRDYEQIYQLYHLKLAEGIKAPSPFEPQKMDESLSGLLANWNTIGEKLETRLENWTEGALDQVSLPHPALGPLTMREMLLFTILHTRHHLKAMQRILKNRAE